MLVAEHRRAGLADGHRQADIIWEALKTFGAKWVCFGSDTPFAMMHVELVMYETLMRDEVTEAEKLLVLGGNIARLFKN